MREVASLASSYDRQRLPASLMQRLALMQELAALAIADGQAHPGRAARAGPRLRTQAIVLAWFSLGVLASGAMGAGAVVGLRALAAGQSPIAWAAWATMPPSASTAQPEVPADAWTIYQVAIDRSATAQVPLPLQLTGADAATVEIVLDGLPPAVRPSRGEPRADSTWVLDRADLGDLHLQLDSAAPETFDVKIVVLAPAGVVTAGSVVQVRLVDAAPRKQADQGTTESPAATDRAATGVAKSAPAATPARARTPVAREGDKAGAPPAQRRAAHAPVEPAGSAAQSASAPRSAWPEGAYALGAMPREAERQVWWEMPQLSWSPFQDRP